jgi:DNA-directed RNA polymerase subunit K/omega
MGYQPLEELLPKSGMSVYKLVRIASKRALQISETGGGHSSNVKLATVALDEIRVGKVVEKSVEKEFDPKNAGKK